MSRDSTNPSQIISLLLIFAPFFAPLANAFRLSKTATPPIFPPFDFSVELKKQSQPTQGNEVAQSNPGSVFSNKLMASRIKYKYDLGLGKNNPMTNKTSGETTPVDNNQEPTQFLIDHQSVRPYPSPLNLESQKREGNSSKNKRENLPEIQHRRHSKDVLHIRDVPTIASSMDDYNKDHSFHPIIVPVNMLYPGYSRPVEKLDINTIWVEMMIHDEQKKFSTIY